MVQYKQAQAVVRKTIRQAKRSCWRRVRGSTGSTTQVGEVCEMIKKMGGKRRGWNNPVVNSGGEVAVTNKEKAELMVKAFVAAQKSH